VGFEPVDVTVTVPVALPADPGANLTVNVLLWPAVSVTGVVTPFNENPVPLTAT